MNISNQLPAFLTSSPDQNTDSAASDGRSFANMLAKQISQDTADTKEAENSPREILMNMLEMTPAERIRYSLLHEMGLTEATLLNLPPDVRMKVEAMIKDEIERQLAGTDGEQPTPAAT